MKFYTQQHPHYCGIDLHARTMYLCILNQAGAIVLHRNMKAEPDSFLKAIAPFRDQIVVAVECIFTWYWLADLCAREGIAFVLGHALYMKAIHGGKAKNDKIDAQKIAVLLRGGMIPQAYVYPEDMRSTRDLLRRRMHLMHQRSQLLTHIQNTNSQYNLPEIGKKIAYKSNRTGVAERFADVSVRSSITFDLRRIDFYDGRMKSNWRSCATRSFTTRTLSVYWIPFPASARSWPWSFSMRFTTSPGFRRFRISSPIAVW
jgi:hypothetical protein